MPTTVVDPGAKDEIIAQLRREIAIRDARVAEAETRVQEVVYVASHDLVEPLRMVKSFLGLLERRTAGQLDERSLEFMAFAVDGADRMKILIDDLLRYSRAGSTDLNRRPIGLAELLTGASAKLRPLVAENEAVVTLDDDLPVLDVDPVAFEQLLHHLLANAVRFRPEERGNAVRVSAHRQDGAWSVVVADDGIGFDPAHTDRIFKPFQRLHARDEYPGSGIGLAICQRIAERHGARLTADSRPGKGARFELMLPDEVTK